MLMHKLTEHQLANRKILIGILGLNALLYILWVTMHVIKIANIIESIGNAGWAISWDTSSLQREFRVTIALIISTCVLLSRKKLGILISIVGLFYIQVEYILWYIKTIEMRGSTGNLNYFETQCIMGFYAARWWHIWILLLIISLICWEIRILLKGKSNFNLCN